MLNCGHPVTRSLVVAALRHWAAEYRVEGFVFNNAENLTQVCVGGRCVCGVGWVGLHAAVGTGGGSRSSDLWRTSLRWGDCDENAFRFSLAEYRKSELVRMPPGGEGRGAVGVPRGACRGNHWSGLGCARVCWFSYLLSARGDDEVQLC